MALGDELAVVVGDDSRRLLAAMLERVQTQHRQRARIGVAEDAENAALSCSVSPSSSRVSGRPVMACRFRLWSR